MDAQRRNYGECVWERNTVAVTDKSAIVCNCVQGHGGVGYLGKLDPRRVKGESERDKPDWQLLTPAGPMMKMRRADVFLTS